MAAPSKKLFELYVSRVPWTLATKEMRDYFAQFGQVKKCLFPYDKETGFLKGFGWVAFSTEESLNSALEKNPHVLEGSEFLVQKNMRQFTGRSSIKDDEHD